VIRINIEIDGETVSSTAVKPTDSRIAPSEWLSHVAVKDPTDAGSAPDATADTSPDFDRAGATDAGASREERDAHKPSSEDDLVNPKNAGQSRKRRR